MKTMKKILFAVAAAVLVCSCAKDNTTDNAKVDEQGVYYEFTATIDDLTRVELNDEKTKAFWQVGDKVAVSDGSTKKDLYVTAIDENGVATISGEISITPTMAYYPSWLWKANGELNFPNPQNYSTSIPVPMKGAIVDGAVTFSAQETNAAVIAFPLKGDITITSAKLCLAANQKIYARNETNNRRFYNLGGITNGLTLNNDEATTLYFVVHGSKSDADKFCYYTLDVTTSDVSDENLVSSFDLVRRKVSALNSSMVFSGAIVAFPEMTLTKDELNENRHTWRFGSNYATVDEKGLIDGWGQNTQDNNTLGLGNNKLAPFGTQHEEFITISDAHKQGIQSQDDTNVKLRFNFGRGAYSDHRKFTTHLGNYRYFAIKWSAPAMIATSTGGVIKLDCNHGSFRNGANNAKTGEIACDEENVVIWYFNLTDEFKQNTYLTTSAPVEFNYFGFKVCDAVFPIADYSDAEGNIVPPTYDVYWAGFFNSVAEIEAFEAAE